jgi:lysophospholipase L1-like esterase
LLSLTATLLATGLLEVGARLTLAALGPEEVPLEVEFEEGRGGALRDVIYEPDPDTFFRLRPHLEIKGGSDRIFDVRTNSLGLRAGEVADPKPQDVYRVLCLGDSCTFGSGAGQDQTYPAQLEQQFRSILRDRKVEVVNAGVPGYSSHQGLQFLKGRGLALEPDAVVIAFGYNDCGDAGPGPKRSFRRDLLLTDREYAARKRSWARLGILRLALRLAPKLRSPEESSKPAAPAASEPVKLRVPLADFEDNLRRMTTLCSEREIHPIFVVWPIAEQASGTKPLGRHAPVPRYQDLVREVAQELRSPLVDLVPLLEGRSNLFLDVVHLKPAGYKLVAQAVRSAVHRSVLADAGR